MNMWRCNMGTSRGTVCRNMGYWFPLTHRDNAHFAFCKMHAREMAIRCPTYNNYGKIYINVDGVREVM